MIDLYTWSTPNGRKVSIMLEETGLPYAVHPVDITRGEQHRPGYLAVCPNGKIPAIVDPDGPDGAPLTLWESGAILLYLARKTGRFLPARPREEWAAIQWLMFQMGGVGPMFGQAHHFLRFAPERLPYPTERYRNETRRLYGVLDRRLAEVDYLAGAYGVADMATYPWVARHEWQEVSLGDFPAVADWYGRVGERPAVVRGMKVPG